MKTNCLVLLCVLLSCLADAQFPAPYCTTRYASVMPITRVALGTIDNASSAASTNQHENFTGLNTPLIAGNSYQITVEGTFQGVNSEDFYMVFFDWNNDGELGFYEKESVGRVYNTTASGVHTVTKTFQVPYSAAEGVIRMRVVKNRHMQVNACDTTGVGQAEDYTVTIAYPTPVAVFVNPAASGLNNGTSWANAYRSLDSGLVKARPRDTIKVAAGTYKPTATFSPKDGCIVLGGYPATGNPSETDRNFSRHQTIISGEKAGAEYYLSAHHMFTFKDQTFRTTLDGFILEKSYGSWNPDKPEEEAGAIYIRNSNPRIQHCVFRNNYTSYSGSVVYVTKGDPLFLNCFFVNNELYVENELIANTSSSRTAFVNCVFARNLGPIIHNDQSTATITNCSFVNNLLTTTGMPTNKHNYTIAAENNSTVLINNSIIAHSNREALEGDSTDLLVKASIVTIRNSILRDLSPGNPELINLSPKFRDSSSAAGPDGYYFTSDDGFQLVNPCSPAINKGTNTVVSVNDKDILGRARIFSSAVDLGAYELQENIKPVPSVIYVSMRATGTRDGSSWQNAYTDLQQAFMACSDTIKIAAGTYYPSSADQLATFSLERNRVVLGGYPASGNPADTDRDPKINETILSGNLPATGGKRSAVLLFGRSIDSTSIVDGLTMKETEYFLSDNFLYWQCAAVCLTNQSAPVIRNCRFKNSTRFSTPLFKNHQQSKPLVLNCSFESTDDNGNDPAGSAVINYTNSEPRFIRCIFTGFIDSSGAANDAGGIYNYDSRPYIDSCTFLNYTNGSIFNNKSNSIIRNSTFHNNIKKIAASMLFNRGSSVQVFNCVFSGNSVPGNGGIVNNLEGSTAIFTKCEFRNGRSEWYGGAVYNESSSAEFNYCVFADNTAKRPGGAVYNNNSKASFNHCVGVNNTASEGGLFYNVKSEVSVNHCTFIRNYSTGYESAPAIMNADNTRTTLRNSLFYDNQLFKPHSREIVDVTSTTPTAIFNSIMKYTGVNGVNGNVVGIHPRLADNSDPDGPDDIFFTADDGLALSPCSPAIEAGNNAFASGIVSDVLDKARLYGTSVDIGAYEFQGVRRAPQTYYVKSGAAGSNAGTSWQHAYTDLQKGLCEPCADTLKVAAAVYRGNVPIPTENFFINQPLTVMGGYTGEKESETSDPANNPTVLTIRSGAGADSMVMTGNILRIHPIGDTVTIDGLEIRDNFQQTGGISINPPSGAAILTRANYTFIRNCRIMNNVGGGLAVNRFASVTVTRSLFEGNQATHAGGAIIDNGDSLKVFDCVFTNNTVGIHGGAIFISEGSDYVPRVDIANSVFYRNRSTDPRLSRGGAFMCTEGSGYLYNNTFVENSTANTLSTSGGAVCTEDNFGIRTVNCIFSGNRSGTNTSVIGTDMDWDGSYNLVSGSIMQAPRNFMQPKNGLAVDPKFVNVTNPKGADGKWGTNDDGLQLNYNSPAINRGDTTARYDLVSDIAGNPRIVNTFIDAGAYEYQDKPVANAGPDTTICVGDSLSIGTPADSNHTYNWTSLPAGFQSTMQVTRVSPAVTTTYLLAVSHKGITVYDTVIVTPSTAIAPSVTITTATTNICDSMLTTFTAHPSYAGAAPVYQWMVNDSIAGTNSASFSTSALKDSSKVKLFVTSSLTCASPLAAASNVLTMKVNPRVSPSVSIQTASATVCSGVMTTFTAVPVNGGATPDYIWYHGGVRMTSGSSYSTAYIQNGDKIMLVMGTSEACAIQKLDTAVIVMSVRQAVTPYVTITSGTPMMCAGNTITFRISSKYNAVSPVYTWKKNGIVVGTGGELYSTVDVADGDVITVTIRSDSTPCATAMEVTSNGYRVSLAPTPSIVISGATNVNKGSATLLTATATNPQAIPTLYQWQDSTSSVGWKLVPGGSNATLSYYPANGSKIRCIIALGSCSATSNVLAFKVDSITTGLPSVEQYGIKYFPNPVEQFLTIDSLNPSAGWETVEIISTEGREKTITETLRNQTRVTVNVSRLKTGIYIAILKRKKGVPVTFRFIKL
jgi:hypothetical protein